MASSLKRSIIQHLVTMMHCANKALVPHWSDRLQELWAWRRHLENAEVNDFHQPLGFHTKSCKCWGSGNGAIGSTWELTTHGKMVLSPPPNRHVILGKGFPHLVRSNPSNPLRFLESTMRSSRKPWALWANGGRSEGRDFYVRKNPPHPQRDRESRRQHQCWFTHLKCVWHPTGPVC